MSFRVSSGLSTTNIARSFNVAVAKTPPIPYVPKHWISDWFELLLKKISLNKLGPTVATRWLYITSSAIYNSYQYITKNKTPIDNEYWTSTQKGVLSTDLNYIESWIELSCRYFLPKLIKNYMNLTISPLTDDEVNQVITLHSPLVNINTTSLNKLKLLLDNYLQHRDSDGWKLTTTFDGTLPNGTNVIYADNSQDQNLNTLPQPNKWTPLQFGASKKNYLTPEWGTKNKGILSDDDFKELLDTTDQLFPSDSQYESEMKETQEITQNLTNEQKVVAEFWAGGPGTVTPPGMWVVFLDIYLRSNCISLLTEIKSYSILCTGLYQSSICAWRLKRDHLQARPIQKIRQYENGNPLSQPWNNQILGQYWLPYQELNFVTPPFPDFVSGHSTFSSSSAKLFCYLFQTDTINLKNPVINNDILQYLSPVLTNTVNFSLNNTFIFPDTSTIEDGVPSTAINLNWNTWNDMARSSGKSRLYGGIHVESSNQGGQLLGSNIADKIWNLMKNI
jgi:hypothetical protein